VLTKIIQVQFPAQAATYDIPSGIAKKRFDNCFRCFFDGLRPDAEHRRFVLACLDYLYSCRTGGKHGADVAIGALQAGAASRVAAVDCAEPVGVMYLHHLVIVLLNVKAGTVHYGKQSN